MTIENEILPEETSRLLSEQLRFQKRWQTISMSTYVVSTVGTLVCTSAAGLLAALEHNQIAAVLAAISTVLVGVEKSLLFRDKWKFHLLMHTKLKLLEADIAMRLVSSSDAARRLGDILSSYAADLPFQARQ